MASISTILPPRTVKPMTDVGRPLGATTTPAAPLTSGRPHERREVGERERLAGHGGGSPDQRRRRRAAAAVGAQHDLGVEHGHERVEVTAAGGGEEGVDHLALAGQVGVGRGRGALHPAPGPAGELAGRVRGAADDRGDLVEGHGEHVVQHEGEPLGRRQRVEHDEQREADRVGQQRLVLGVDRRVRGSRSGRARARPAAPRGACARAQHVEADAGDDRRQPSAQVLDAARHRRGSAAATLPARRRRPR